MSYDVVKSECYVCARELVLLCVKVLWSGEMWVFVFEGLSCFVSRSYEVVKSEHCVCVSAGVLLCVEDLGSGEECYLCVWVVLLCVEALWSGLRVSVMFVFQELSCFVSRSYEVVKSECYLCVSGDVLLCVKVLWGGEECCPAAVQSLHKCKVGFSWTTKSSLGCTTKNAVQHMFLFLLIFFFFSLFP